MNSISYLLSLQSRGIKLGLKRTIKLLNYCKNPEKKLKCIQIAGTNGKGSVSAIISNTLCELGYKVGLYTSPHLVRLNERIRINGKPISNQDLKRFIDKYRKEIDKNKSSFFEAMTLIAFSYFKDNNTDIAILETGLGGKFDSVTTCNPELVVFTPISLDHKEILGNTIEKITLEKAGIIKENTPVFSSKQKIKAKKILLKKADELKAPIYFCNYKQKIKPKFLKGKHQQENAQLAFQIISFLYNYKKDIIINAIENTKWPGRYQIIKDSPYIIFDVGHNEEGINVFLKQYKREKIKGKKYLILVLQHRKKITKVKNKIEKLFDFIICSETENKFSMNYNDLYKIFNSEKTIKIKNIDEAIEKIDKKLDKDDSLAIIGSHYLGNSIKRVYKKSFDIL